MDQPGARRSGKSTIETEVAAPDDRPKRLIRGIGVSSWRALTACVLILGGLASLLYLKTEVLDSRSVVSWEAELSLVDLGWRESETDEVWSLATVKFTNDGPRPAAFRADLTTSGYGDCPATVAVWVEGTLVEAGPNPEVLQGAVMPGRQSIVVKNIPQGAQGRIQVLFISCTWSEIVAAVDAAGGSHHEVEVPQDAPIYRQCDDPGIAEVARRASDGRCVMDVTTAPSDGPVALDRALQEMVPCVRVRGERVENRGAWCLFE